MPSNNISSVFFYTYILHSLKDNNYYTGFTSNLKKRLEEHQGGQSIATEFRRPFKLVYYEACLSELDAKQREKYLKTSPGRKFLAKRLSNFNTANDIVWRMK